MAPPLDIVGLEWSEEAEQHVERHISAWEVEELIEGGDFFAFPNTAGHPPHRLKIVGRTPAGLCLTVVLEEPRDGDPSAWRPVTGWRSEPPERRRYETQRALRDKKRGRMRG